MINNNTKYFVCVFSPYSGTVPDVQKIWPEASACKDRSTAVQEAKRLAIKYPNSFIKFGKFTEAIKANTWEHKEL